MKELEELEKKLEELKKSNRASWDMYGSELCAGDMIGQEEHLQEQINSLKTKKKMEVFLGGTCADSTWREELIPQLEIGYFNPVVEDWDEEAYQLELEKRETCDYMLYVLTPLMEGVYSIAEVVDDSNKRPNKTIFCVLEEDDGKFWTKAQLKSLVAVEKMVTNNGGLVLEFDEIPDVLNSLA